MMLNVFLDDTRPCPAGFRLARTVDQCIALLQQHKVNILSLDHDLGFNQPTGYDLAKYMTSHQLYPNHIIIHSANPLGRLRMYYLLKKHKPPRVTLAIHPRPFHMQ